MTCLALEGVNLKSLPSDQYNTTVNFKNCFLFSATNAGFLYNLYWFKNNTHLIWVEIKRAILDLLLRLLRRLNSCSRCMFAYFYSLLFFYWNLGAAWYLVGIFPNIPAYSIQNSHLCLCEQSWYLGIYRFESASTKVLYSRNTEYSLLFPLQHNNSKSTNMEYSGIFKKNLASITNLRR